MHIDAYLERIGYQGPLEVNSHTLRDLQLAHLLTIPFENLSIHANEPIILEDGALFDKVVKRRRGGFCYELNGLFAALLRALGFDVSMLSARVAQADGGFTPDFDHMTLLVSLGRDWLVDVGFGDTFRQPLVIDDTSEQRHFGRGYKFVADGGHSTLSERKHDQEWEGQYRFTRRPYEYSDFVPRCAFHQTSPESHFRRGRVCSRATPEGRLTLSEMTFITTTHEGGRNERTLSDEEEYVEVLREHFGIVM